MSRYIFSKNSRWYISEVFDPSDSKLQEKASYYTLTDDVTGPYYAVGTSDSASIGVSYVPVVEPAGAIEAGIIDANGNFQPLSFNGTQASDSGSAVAGLQHKIFNTGHDEPDYGGSGGSGGAAMDFYKCSYVNSNSWGGYKAVQDPVTGIYSFESDSTVGLPISTVIPAVGSIYSTNCFVKAHVYSNTPYSIQFKDFQSGTSWESTGLNYSMSSNDYVQANSGVLRVPYNITIAGSSYQVNNNYMLTFIFRLSSDNVSAKLLGCSDGILGPYYNNYWIYSISGSARPTLPQTPVSGTYIRIDILKSGGYSYRYNKQTSVDTSTLDYWGGSGAGNGGFFIRNDTGSLAYMDLAFFGYLDHVPDELQLPAIDAYIDSIMNRLNT